MATVFPNNLDGFTTKVDNVDAVLAAHINDVQSSVVALQQKVGVNASLISTTVDYKLRNLPDQDGATVVDNLNADYLDGANLSNDGTFTDNSDLLIPTQKAAKTYADTKVPSSYLDNDGTLTANSDSKVATQKAVKTYVDKETVTVVKTYTGLVTVSGGLILETRTSDPASPATGRIWLRTDI